MHYAHHIARDSKHYAPHYQMPNPLYSKLDLHSTHNLNECKSYHCKLSYRKGGQVPLSQNASCQCTRAKLTLCALTNYSQSLQLKC